MELISRQIDRASQKTATPQSIVISGSIININLNVMGDGSLLFPQLHP
jgi:hypothetical protein